jgi:Phage integrase, N-terminal SAM-like domain
LLGLAPELTSRPMIEAAVLGKDQDPSLGHYLKDWLAYTRGRVRARTYQGYESLVRCYAVPALGEVRLPELSGTASAPSGSGTTVGSGT